MWEYHHQGQPWGRRDCARQGQAAPTAPDTPQQQGKKQNSSPKLSCVQCLPHGGVLLQTRKQKGRAQIKGREGGRKKSLMQIKSRFLQPSCKLGMNCTHLHFCGAEDALQRALPAQPQSLEAAPSQGRTGEPPQQPQHSPSSTRESSRRGK